MKMQDLSSEDFDEAYEMWIKDTDYDCEILPVIVEKEI